MSSNQIRVTVVNNQTGYSNDILVYKGATAKEALESQGIVVAGTSAAVTIDGQEVSWNTVLEEAQTVGFSPKKVGGAA